MASVNARVVLFILMVSLLYTKIASARVHLGFSVRQKPSGKTRVMLRELGFDEHALEYYRRRAIMLDAGTMRVAPGGPDPHHHSKTPALS